MKKRSMKAVIAVMLAMGILLNGCGQTQVSKSENNSQVISAEDVRESSDNESMDVSKGNQIVPDITYQAHVQKDGWQKTVKNSAVAGTTNQSKRLEALKINLSKSGNSMVRYKTHIASSGWEKTWKSSGQLTGTTGKKLAIEAIQIELVGEYKNKYDIYYSVHVRSYGWLGWAKNGATAGSTGLSARLEAIKIALVSKSDKFETGGRFVLDYPSVEYQSHVQSNGWLKKVKDGGTAGTTNQSKRLEALKIWLKDYKGKSGISYKAHVADIGWQGWNNSGGQAGTTGKKKAIEAVQIKLNDLMGKFFDVYYRVHSQHYGWLGWAKNGQTAGTTGGGIRAEAVQIKLVVKDKQFNVGGAAYKDLSKKEVSYSTFINDARWKNGINWNGNQRPKMSSYDSQGCAAYCADYVKFLYGNNSPRGGISFNSPSQIKSGDVLYINRIDKKTHVSGEHWFVVLSRDGKSLYTAEGNCDSKVCISKTKYSVDGNKLIDVYSSSVSLVTGYHFQ